jgi:hypothetical protein
LAFGPFQSARVATLGLNPSKSEFRDKSGKEFHDSERRFETLTSLGANDLATLDDERVQRIVAGCNHYFSRNPYRRWFDQLEPMVRSAGASYYDGSSCHLDLVQWATDPVWGELAEGVRRQMVDAGKDFLKAQLEQESIKTLLLNGRRVMTEFTQSLKCQLQVQRELQGVNGPVQLVTGHYREKLLVIGWSVNIQSSFGVTHKLRTAVADFVREAVANNSCV